MGHGFVTPSGAAPPTRVQSGTQATTAALTVIGTAIEAPPSFTVEAWINLGNMVAGDVFLVVEEIRDQDDATYVETGRTEFYDAQTSPMVQFASKDCDGWRIRIQRTAGADRDVNYQFYRK